jgi:hypothetical protein
MWFFQGSVFEEWKSSPSLLWIYGKRALSFPLKAAHLKAIFFQLAQERASCGWSFLRPLLLD